ncbi:uncharacterized protein LOC113292989 [Papaver somniferum]|uniref:uncharacterized protein LOC113292989 n=1 Tax=Papaver somniferum TaxID=3469 RepID=UPI000E701BD2|nr:uncharacterized protein LOC113292989 [Papaver somniferum]
MGHISKMDHHHHHHQHQVVTVVAGQHHGIANKQVLPICDAITTSSVIIDEEKDHDGKVIKSSSNGGDATSKVKAMTRMKMELLRWAAVAKQQTEKGSTSSGKTSFISRKVAYFRNRGNNTIKALRNIGSDDREDVGSLSSPKISFKWDVVSSCSTTNSVSAYSTMSLPITSNIKSKYHHRHDIKTTYKSSSSSSPSNFIIATPTPAAVPDNHHHKDDFVSTASSPASSQYNNSQRTSRFGSWITTDDEFLVLEL